MDKKINYLKVIGFGALLWVLMFVIVSVFVAYNLYNSTGVQVVLAIISGVIAYILAGFLKPEKISTALCYGISWVVIGVILDAIVTLRFNPEIFRSWPLWLGYGLGVLALVLRVKKAK